MANRDAIEELKRLCDLLEHILVTPGYGEDQHSRDEAADYIASARQVIAEGDPVHG